MMLPSLLSSQSGGGGSGTSNGSSSFLFLDFFLPFVGTHTIFQWCRRPLLELGFPHVAPCQLNVLWHDGNLLGMDGREVGAFKETNQVHL